MKDALKRGNCFINNGAYGLLLLVESDGKEPGAEVRVGPDSLVPLTIEVFANRPLEEFEDGIRIIQGGRVVQTIPTKAGEWTMEVETQVKVDAREDTWLVGQACGQWPSMALTNAIYLDVPPYGNWGAGEWTPPEGAVTWNNPWPVVPEITIPDGPSQPPYPQPEAAFGYGRPMTREIAEKLLREQYEINEIEEDVEDSRAFDHLN
jgi:hypothetical protein